MNDSTISFPPEKWQTEVNNYTKLVEMGQQRQRALLEDLVKSLQN
jgi:hypothetical protein